VNRKPYETPRITAVRLEVQNAILAACHKSPNLTPREAPVYNCALATACYNP